VVWISEFQPLGFLVTQLKSKTWVLAPSDVLDFDLELLLLHSIHFLAQDAAS
jgi:hypothetical protein